MKRETLHAILTIIALIPMTYFFILTIYFLFVILSSFDLKDTPYLVSMIFGVLGYVGLVMNLKQNKVYAAELTNFIFLSLGLIGFIFFYAYQGGIRAWQWILFIEEPDEWIMSVGPILITIFLTVTKGKRLLALYKHNAER